MRLISAVLFALAIAASSGLASAEQAARREGGVIRLEEITIEGRVQKPNAFYVLQRSSLGFEQSTQQQSFVPEVLESVNHAPFQKGAQ
jgi:hypothetical protein